MNDQSCINKHNKKAYHCDSFCLFIIAYFKRIDAVIITVPPIKVFVFRKNSNTKNSQ